MISADGEDVSASSGITLPVDCAATAAPRYDMIIICAGIDYADSYAPAILAWLRKLNREGCILGALSTGVFLLAKAGLLEGRRCSVHWEALASFRNEFPKSFVTDDIFAIDGRFLTSSGGTVTLDMMLYIVTATHGYELASLISDQFNHPKIRRQDDAQRMHPEARFGISNAKLSFVIRRMEASLDQPIGIADLADSINLSARQLERLFISDLGKTPQKFYIELRMTRARDLLLQSSLSIAEVAGICGYASSSHFGRFYRQHFNESPVETRKLDLIGRMAHDPARRAPAQSQAG